MRYSELTCAYQTKAEDSNVATFSGVASTSDVDKLNEVIEAGAFLPIARKDNGDPDVLMLRDHDRTQIIGGWKSFAQQGPRLVVEGELCLDVEKARETYALMKRGFLSGLSVGFTAGLNDVKYDDRNGRRTISKATLKECSIVAAPANGRARVLSVKSDVVELLSSCGLDDTDIDILLNEGLDGLIECKRNPQKPYGGNVPYADPGYQDDGVHRYPIDTERHIRAAWSYINMPKNQRMYSADQVKKIMGRIKAAWRNKIDPAGPPGASDGKGEDWNPLDEMRVASEVRGLLSQLRERCHG